MSEIYTLVVTIQQYDDREVHVRGHATTSSVDGMEQIVKLNFDVPAPFPQLALTDWVAMAAETLREGV